MPFFSIKVKVVPPKGFKSVTVTGIAFGKKGNRKQAESKAVEHVKASFSARFPKMQLNYIIVESNSIKEDFFVNIDK